MTTLATGGDPSAVPVTAGGVILAVIVLVFALLTLAFMVWYTVRLVHDARSNR